MLPNLLAKIMIITIAKAEIKNNVFICVKCIQGIS